MLSCSILSSVLSSILSSAILWSVDDKIPEDKIADDKTTRQQNELLGFADQQHTPNHPFPFIMAALDIKSAEDVLQLGLEYVGISYEEQEVKSHKLLVESFHDHYGCIPVDLAQMWYDLQTTDIQEAKLKEDEKNEKGFRMFMAANYFIWTNPKNAGLVSSRFKICKRYVQSNQQLWKWVLKMGALMPSKVVWDEATLGSDDYFHFIASADCVDFNIWEKPSERYNVDKGLMSFKSKHAALRYLIAVSIWDSSCIYVHGPVRAGEVNDILQWRLDLKQKMLALPGKMLVTDGGFQTSENDEIGICAIPNARDNQELRTFKTRVRQRHESFNGRLKCYKILQDVFRFDPEKHVHVVHAVITRVHYAMESGSPLFDP